MAEERKVRIERTATSVIIEVPIESPEHADRIVAGLKRQQAATPRHILLRWIDNKVRAS